MKKWHVVIVLALAQFVMVLDSTVMNVSIAEVVADLGTTVSSLQMAITFYTLTMAAFMLLGGKLGSVWGKRRVFMIGISIYAIGALITGLSPNIGTLMFGWSFIEGLGAVLVIPAVVALIAENYKGRDRVTGYAVIGGIAGAAAAAGPLIGGFVTTYFSWRYVFFSEVLIMAIVLLFSYKITDASKRLSEKIDIPSVLLSSVGMMVLVYGILQSKTWGWVTPMSTPVINGHDIAPLGISLVAYLIIIGLFLLKLFYDRQKHLVTQNRKPLLDPALLGIKQLRSGLSVLAAQYLIIAGLFFILPVYLQMTLGYDALQTGLHIVPLSFAVILFSMLGSRLVGRFSPKRIVQFGQYAMVVGSLILLGSVSLELKRVLFSVGMALVGSGLGLLASQISNVNMSAVDEKEGSAVGGLQGVAQNLGSSLGTALIGSVLIASLTTNFVQDINASSLPSNIKSFVQENSQAGVLIVSKPQVDAFAEKEGVSDTDAAEVAQIYSDSQVRALRGALFAIAVLGLLSLVLVRHIPNKKIIN